MSHDNQPLLDAHNRPVNYLRLSVTDRCNLRCRYCRVDNNFIEHDRVLRYEEMERLINLLTGMGVKKLRLTGGEPLVRKGFMDFLSRLRETHPDLGLHMTSNGLLLAQYAKLLKELGVHVNLSLDSLHPERFARITGRDRFAQVWDSLQTMLEYGVSFKINAVALKGFNDDELPDFLSLAGNYGLDVRFIEFMPIGDSTLWSGSTYWPAKQILEDAQKILPLTQLPRQNGLDGPARMYAIGDGQGRFGLITAMSNHFCAACNRLRLTSDGRLRTCLFDWREYNLAPVLRHPGLDDSHLEKVIRAATRKKPIGADLLAQKTGTAVISRSMTGIGG